MGSDFGQKRRAIASLIATAGADAASSRSEKVRPR